MLCTVSSKIDEVLLINPSANVFVFGDFNVHHKDWLTYSGGTDRPGELCYNFSISNDLTQIVNFPIRIPDCDSHSPAFLDLFLLRDVPWEDIFKLSGSAAASEFCEWVQVGIDVYIPHRKYQVKPHSSPWFSAACAAAIVHRNHFFRLYQQNKSSESKVKFRQASNRCKRVFEAANLHVLLKQKSPSLLRNLALGTFGELLIVFSTKVNLLYLLYSTDRRCCLLYLIKQNYLLKTFPRTQILMTRVSLYLFSFLELI